MRTRAIVTLIIAAVCLLAARGPLVADDQTAEEADTLTDQVRELCDIYWDGFGAESTGLLYHTRINGPKGIGALASPEEIAARTVRGKEMRWGYGSGIQDVALENGELLFALCDAYDATGEEWIATLARRAWRGLKTIGSVSPVAGFVPRGPHPDGKSYYPDSSRDQHAVYVYALWRYHKSSLATDEDRAFIVEFMDAFVRRMEAAEWSIYNEDNSAVAHVGFTWRQHALAGVISLMGTLSAIADATENPEWIALLEQYADEGEGFRRKTLTPEGFSAWKGYNLYSDQYGLDLAAMSRILGESEHGDQVRGFMRAFAAGAMHSNVFDTDHWRRLDWAGQWSDEVTEEALAPFGLSLQTPATALELWPHFSAEHMRAPERATIAVNNKLCFGIPTVPMHLAMLSGDVELTAEAAPVVLEMIQVMLQHGAGYAGGENLNRSVIMGLYLIANSGGE